MIRSNTYAGNTPKPSASTAPKTPRPTPVLKAAPSSKTPTKSAPNPWAQSPQTTATPTYTAQSTVQTPQYIQDSTTQDAINNTMAQGHANADQRFQVKNLDRAGVSRGAGQNFMAAQEGVQQMQKAAESASEVEAADQEQNSQMKSDFQKASEMEAQNNAMIQHQLAQTEWAKNFAQQSMQAQLEIAQQQAMLQLQLTLLR